MAATGIRVGGGSTNWLGGLPARTISARISPPCAGPSSGISRSLPFWICTVLKRKPLPLRCSSASSFEATLIFHEVVSAISVLMSRLRCQPAQSWVRSCTAVPMRGALAAAPRRSAYSARCGCTWPRLPARGRRMGQSRTAAKAKRTSRRHRGTLRTGRHRVNRARHEFARDHGGNPAAATGTASRRRPPRRKPTWWKCSRTSAKDGIEARRQDDPALPRGPGLFARAP